MTKTTLAIIVTYNPRIGELAALLSFLTRSDVDTLVIDNSSSNVDAISVVVPDHPRAVLVKLDRNSGIAHAQNIGLTRAIAAGYRFALLLDQDSLPEGAFVETALQAFRTLDPDGTKIAAVAPSFYDQTTRYRYPFVRFDRFRVRTFEPTEPFERVSLIISSGSMLRLRLLHEIGLMNDALYIDHVDTDWSLRAIAKGYELVGLRDNTMRHSVGDATIRVLGRNLPAHNPRRRYLSTRNLFYLIFHANAPLQWKVKEATTSMLKLILVLPVIAAPAAHVRSYLLGMRDGVVADFARHET